MKVFKFKFGLTSFIMEVRCGITLYKTRKVIKKYIDLVFRDSECARYVEARLLLGKGYEMRIFQGRSETDLHDVAITHERALNLSNEIIDSMRLSLSISSAEVERLMDKAQKKEW